MNFEEKNGFSFKHNQYNEPNRGALIKLIEVAGKLSNDKAVKSAPYACYFISNLELYIFAKINNVSATMIAEFLFTYGYFVANEGCFQTAKGSSVNCLKDLQNNGMLKKGYSLLDIDFRYSGWNRQKVYDEMIKELSTGENVNLRVCFCSKPEFIDTPQESAHDHALIVATDDQGGFVVCDTSWRGHSYPENSMKTYINAKNIRWFTAIVED